MMLQLHQTLYRASYTCSCQLPLEASLHGMNVITKSVSTESTFKIVSRALVFPCSARVVCSVSPAVLCNTAADSIQSSIHIERYGAVS